MSAGSTGLACHANHLLRALKAESFRALEAHLQTVELHLGKVLYEPDEIVQFAYFPHDAVISLIAVLSSGKTMEVNTIGCEGIAGFVDSLGNCATTARYVVQFAGTASRISIKYLQNEMETDAVLRGMLLSYLKASLAQTFQIGVCNAVHSMENRCGRLMLTMRDRTGRDELPLTHEFLAEMLGVNRPAVSIAMRHLQQAGFIRQSRGAITITDEVGLQGVSCECYNTIRRYYEQHVPDGTRA